MVSQDGDALREPPSTFKSLNGKQERALQTATEMGFFDRPQDATANEVANRLGVSRSTFLYHLRGAEQKIFMSVYGVGHDSEQDDSN